MTRRLALSLIGFLAPVSDGIKAQSTGLRLFDVTQPTTFRMSFGALKTIEIEHRGEVVKVSVDEMMAALREEKK